MGRGRAQALSFRRKLKLPVTQYTPPRPQPTHQQIATLRKRLATAFNVSWAQTFVAVPYAALPAPASAGQARLRSSSALDGSSHAPAGVDGSLSSGPAAARSFEVDRLALLIASASLEAARLKAEGKAPVVAADLPHTPKSVFTPASTITLSTSGVGFGSVRRQPTVDLSTLDGSFSSNFHLSPQSGKARADTAIAAIAVEKSEQEAP